MKGDGPALVVSLGHAPGSPLVLIGDDTATALAADWIPEGMYLTDAATVRSGTYVLLYEPASLTSNIYLKKGRSLTQVTSSPTMKFSLEGDADTDTLAYVSTSIESEAALENVAAAEIVLLTDGVEKSVSQGIDIVGFAGGELGIKTRDGIVAYHDGVTRGPVYEGAFPVVATDGTRFVAYNALTHALDTYDASGGFSQLRYEASTGVDYIPTALGFFKGGVVAAGVASADTFFVVTPDTRITLPKTGEDKGTIPFVVSSISL